MIEKNRTIVFDISGWTYMVSFPYACHDFEQLICTGRTRLAADDEDELEVGNLYLEIDRTLADGQKSRYTIKEDGISVAIFVTRNDFFRIFQELKDHYQIPECKMAIEIEGPIENGLHEFSDFQLNLSVDRGRYER